MLLPASRASGVLPHLAAMLLWIGALVAPAASQERALPPGGGDALGALEGLSRTGVVYDRVLPLAHLERLDGGPSAPAIDLATWLQGYDELRRATLAAPAGPDLAALDAGTRASLREGVIPLAIFDRAFERVRPEALADGSLRVEGGRVELLGGSPLLESRAFAAAVLASRTFRGADVAFSLEASRFFSDDAAPPRAVAIDFADGRGFRPVSFGERVHARYTATGRHTLHARLTRANGSLAEARFDFDVAALAAPSPNDTLHVTATVPYQGQYGTGDAYVYLAANHSAIVNPIVVVEGLDFDNSMNWDELYALLDQQGLIETLRSEGFDTVVLNFTDATEALQKNSFVVAELIQQIQALSPAQATLAVVGASMGGVCSRYALAYLESHGIPHRVRVWLSFDAPQAGADIPLGLQYWISFFSGQSADAAAFLAILQRPAARQLLIYHLTNPPGTTGQPDPMRATLLADLAALGGYPSLTRRVAIANGSGDRENQGFLPGDQLIRYEYSSLFVAVTGNVWAVRDQTSGNVFVGSLRIFASTTSQTVTVSGTLPWDGAPGGSRPSMAEMDAIVPPYGDIVALHPSHCFIPTVSSLAVATGDPFFDIAGAPDLLALTPFDAVYYPSTNQEHVLITPENAPWVRSEIEQGVVSVPAADGAGARGVTLLAGVPNPFSSATRLSFVLPRPGPVDLRVFGVDGREVRTLVHDVRAAGLHSSIWDGRDARGARVPAGVYFLRLEASGSSHARRLVKLE